MLVAVDLDGTIDADPQTFRTLLDAITHAGGTVAILTGVKDATTITPADVQAKRDRLAALDITYSQLVVFPDDKQMPQAKAAWCRSHGAQVLIDNNRANAQAAMHDCLVLVPWQTRAGKKKNGDPSA